MSMGEELRSECQRKEPGWFANEGNSKSRPESNKLNLGNYSQRGKKSAGCVRLVMIDKTRFYLPTQPFGNYFYLSVKENSEAPCMGLDPAPKWNITHS